jgi:hypothetical protein
MEMDGRFLLMDTASTIFRRKREALPLEEEGKYAKKFCAERMDNAICRGL